MARLGIKSLVQIIVRHPWSSIRDAALISAFMTFVVLIARHYDLFAFIQALADPDREISPAETVLIGLLLGICIAIFVARRMNDERCDAVYKAQLEHEVRELRELAMQDPLTKLPNRRVLLSALDSALESSADCGATHAFFLMDLNGFKQVNDSHGHTAGDHVLQVVVERFRRVARPTDLLARLGGDEFAVLSCNVDRDAACTIGNRYAAALANLIRTDGYAHAIGVAVGGAMIPAHGNDREEILRRADLAMYRAKNQSSSAFAFFDPALDEQQAARGGSPHKAAG